MNLEEYKIENAKITNVDLSMGDYGCLTLSMILEGSGWGCNYGGRVLGHGYVGADTFEGTAEGLECIMRIMDTVGVENFNDLKGKYIRVAIKGWGESIEIIGNIIKDKWFDQKEFFESRNRKGSE